jgi:4'-phosphopantetheinyl transferase EntD
VPGWTASLSHKADLAVAVAAPCVEGWTLGIDLEERGRPRPSIATRVLRPEELARWEADGSSWERLLELFSVKEAIYKALHPHVPRWIGFDEAEIGADGTAVFFPRGDEPRVELRVDFAWDRSRLLCMAAARPLAAG